MKKLIIIFFSVFLVTVLNIRAENLSAKANRAYEEGNYLVAMKMYKKIMYDESLDDQSRYFGLEQMSESLMQMEPDLAIKEIEIIFKEYPYDDKNILIPYATALMKKGEYKKAKKIVDKILILTDNDKYIYKELVVNGLEKMEKKYFYTSVYPEFVNNLYNNSLKYYKTWKKRKNSRMYYKALFYIDSAITIDSNRADLWFFKGIVQNEIKTRLQFELALTSFIQAMMIEPNNYNYELMVAQTLFNLGRYEEAVIRYKHLFKVYKQDIMNYKTLYPFAVSYLAMNKPDEMLKYLDTSLEKYDKHNIDLWIIRAVINKSIGNNKYSTDILKWLLNVIKDEKKRDYLAFLLAKYRDEK